MDEREYHAADAMNQKEMVNSLLKLIMGNEEEAHEYKLLTEVIESPCNDLYEEKVKRLLEDKKGLADVIQLIRKLSAELDSHNDSTFEKSMIEICDTVDISRGVKDLLNDDVKLSTAVEKSGTAVEKSGIEYVISRIKHYLLDSKIAKNVLVEYSLLSSTLDPKDPDRLKCCSFAIGEESFRKCVNDYYTLCIGYTTKKPNEHLKGKGLSIYQHPHFLYDIPIGTRIQKNATDLGTDDQTETEAILNEKGVIITFKKSKIEIDQSTQCNNIGKDYAIPERADGKFKLFNPNTNVSAFTLDRPFKEMLLAVKNFVVAKGCELDCIQNTLHSFCHKNITCNDDRVKDEDGKEKESVYISFPIYGSRASNQLPQYEIKRNDGKVALQGIGACFIYIEPKEYNLTPKEYKKLVEQIIEKVAYEVGKFIRFVSANYMFNLGLQLQENARKEAIKSAKAAIMSRNMSHNLGSHVMSYLKQSLSSVNNIFRDKILSLLIQDVNNLTIDNEIKEAKEKGDQGVLPFLVGLGQFISYIQERQDFIATIATDYIPYLSTVNFKDFIYDELNPDKRYERHKTKQRLKIDNILLGNIARSEGLGRATSPTNEQTLSNIILKFRDFDGNPVEQQDEKGSPLGKAIKGREKEFDTLKSMRAYDFSLPGGVVGRQAVFSIVENVIRNAAKHGNWREKGELALEFNIFTKQSIEEAPRGDSYFDDNQGCELLSLRQVFENFYKDARDSKDLYFITLTDNLSMDEEKLEKLRKAIKEPLINERGEMNEASKGIKEMRISSTWIRSLDEGETYNPIKFAEDGKALIHECEWDPVGKEQFAPALYARISNEHLQYIFCVLRPKKVAIISTQFAKNGDENSLDTKKYNGVAFLKNSWAAFTPKQYYEERNKSYEFILFDDIQGVSSDEKYRYEKLRNISSTRFWKLSDILKNPGSSNLNDSAYEKFFNRIKSMSDNDINDIQTSLYRKLSDFKDGEIIYIDDKTASANDEMRIKESENERNTYKTSDYVKVDDGIKGKGVRLYIYRSHHDTEDRYKAFVKSVNDGDYQGNLFVEGITGNNSTDRLVRNEKLDNVWFYKHLHAMKENVAIFDERLFSKIIGLEEAQLKDDGTFRIDDTNREDYIDKYYNEILQQNYDNYEKFIDLPLNEKDEKLKKAFDNGDKTISSKECENLKGILPIVYKQKGIYLFTLIQEPNPDKRNSFNLYGLKIENDLKNGKCIKLSTLSWNEAGLHFSGEMIDDDINTYKKFERISIHQGLLDKLYEVFNIKDKPEEKKKLTTQFHKKFTALNDAEEQDQKSEETVLDTKVKDFLPGLCIHSGRSKPSKTDMPQKLPFIQYAAIENAVLDCKYSLVELLDFARYE